MADEQARWLAPTFGKRLASWRRHRGYRTAAALANALGKYGEDGMSESVIQNVEAGRKSTPSLGQVLALSRELHIPLPALLLPLGAPGAVDEGGMTNIALDALYSVTDVAIDHAMGLPAEAQEDRDIVRLLRSAYRHMAEVEAWRARGEEAVAAGDQEGIVTAYRATVQLANDLLRGVQALAARGLPTDWLAVHIPDPESMFAAKGGQGGAAADAD